MRAVGERDLFEEARYGTFCFVAPPATVDVPKASKVCASTSARLCSRSDVATMPIRALGSSMTSADNGVSASRSTALLCRDSCIRMA